MPIGGNYSKYWIKIYLGFRLPGISLWNKLWDNQMQCSNGSDDIATDESSTSFRWSDDIATDELSTSFRWKCKAEVHRFIAVNAMGIIGWQQVYL